MDNIRSDQDGRDGPVKVVQDIQGLLGFRIAPIGCGFQFVARSGGKGRLGHAEIRRAQNQRDCKNPWQSTAIIHSRISISFKADYLVL